MTNNSKKCSKTEKKSMENNILIFRSLVNYETNFVKNDVLEHSEKNTFAFKSTPWL